MFHHGTCGPLLHKLQWGYSKWRSNLKIINTVRVISSLEEMVQRICSARKLKFPELSHIRDVYSAGSLRLRLSGVRSRAHSIARYTFPCTNVPRSIEQLLALYQRKGCYTKTANMHFKKVAVSAVTADARLAASLYISVLACILNICRIFL